MYLHIVGPVRSFDGAEYFLHPFDDNASGLNFLLREVRDHSSLSLNK